VTDPCPECGDGRGTVTLLTSARPCRTCAARRAETVNVMTPNPSHIDQLAMDGVVSAVGCTFVSDGRSSRLFRIAPGGFVVYQSGKRILGPWTCPP